MDFVESDPKGDRPKNTINMSAKFADLEAMDIISKRKKEAEEMVYHEIASSIQNLSDAVDTLNETYGTILKVNRAVILCTQDLQKGEETSSEEEESESESEESTKEEEKEIGTNNR